MRLSVALTLLVSCCSFVVSSAELMVPEKLIGKKTVAVVDIHLANFKRDQVLKSVTETMGEAPPKDAEQGYDAFFAKFSAAGGESLSLVFNIQKDQSDPGKGLVLVVGMKDGADAAKVAEFMYTMDPKLKESMAPDCPQEMDGSLVWYQKGFKLPIANADKLEAYEYAYTQVPGSQAFSVVMIPDEDAVEQAKAQLKPEEAELVNSVLGGSGLCLFTNFGVVEQPTIKLLVLTPDATGAEKLHKVSDSLIAEFKKGVPPPFQPAFDALKVVEAGSNVQVSVSLPDLAKVVKEFMASLAAAATK